MLERKVPGCCLLAEVLGTLGLAHAKQVLHCRAMHPAPPWWVLGKLSTIEPYLLAFVWLPGGCSTTEPCRGPSICMLFFPFQVLCQTPYLISNIVPHEVSFYHLSWLSVQQTNCRVFLIPLGMWHFLYTMFIADCALPP